MTNPNSLTELADQPGRAFGLAAYYQRNQRWLMPLLGLAILVMVPLTLTMFDSGLGGKPAALPGWMHAVAYGGCILGAFLVGLGAVFTDTLSADILRVVLPAGALTMALLLCGLSVTMTLLFAAVACAVLALAGRRRGAGE